MKKPLLVILIIGLIPVFLLLIGLIVSQKDPRGPIETDNFVYPYTDDVLKYKDESKKHIMDFFDILSAGKDTTYFFYEGTLDQLKYSDLFDQNLSQVLKNISVANILSIEPFEVTSWTSTDHIYQVSYELQITDNTASPFGSNGINFKLYILTKEGANWYITDVAEAP